MTALPLTGLEKVAVLLKSLPNEVVEKVLRHLGPRHAGLVASALTKLKDQGDLSHKLAGVLEEAASMLGDGSKTKQERPLAGKAATVEAAAAKAPDKDSASTTRVDIRLDGKAEDKPASAAAPKPFPELDAAADPLRALAAFPPDVLASTLDGENSRTISLLMNSLDLEIAGQIYKRLSPAKRKEVSMRFTEQTVVGEELIKRIAQGVYKKCQAARAVAPAAVTGQEAREKRMAALLRGLERADRTEMLTALEEADAELTGRVKAMLYQFEDILRMENTSVQKMLSEVDVKSLALALRGAPTDIEAKMLGNLSKRAQESLKEEISLMGAVSAANVRAARQTLEGAIQRLDQRGDLILIE